MKNQFRHFDMHKDKDVLVIQLVDPRLFDTLIVNELEHELLNVIEQHQPKKVLVSFERVTHCSTSVINSMLRAKKLLLVKGKGHLKLCAMAPMLREAYRLLNLDGTVFQIHDSQAEALVAFGYDKG